MINFFKITTLEKKILSNLAIIFCLNIQIRSTYVRGFYTRDTYARAIYIKNVYIEDANTKNIYIDNTFNMSIYIKNTFINGINPVKYLKMYQ